MEVSVHGTFMLLPSCFHGAPVECCIHGFLMALACDFHAKMILQWEAHGDPTGLPWDSQWAQMARSWDVCGTSIGLDVLSWNLKGVIMGLALR